MSRAKKNLQTKARRAGNIEKPQLTLVENKVNMYSSLSQIFDRMKWHKNEI